MVFKFMKLYRSVLKIFILTLLAAVGISIVNLLIPNLTRIIINDAVGVGDYDLFIKISVLMGFLYLLKVFFVYFVSLQGHMLGVEIEFKMRRNLFDKITSLPIKFFDNNSVGRLMARITNDLNEISEVAHHGPEDFVMMVILVSGSSILMFNMNVTLALVIIVLLPIIVLINIWTYRRFFDTAMNLKLKLADINSQANDTFSGIRQVKAFNNEYYELEKFDQNNNRFFKAKKEYYKVMAKYLCSLESYFSVLNVVAIVLGSYFVIKGDMNIGELTAFIMYVNLFQTPINKFANLITEYHKAATGFARYLELMALDSQEDYKNAKNIECVAGKVEFKNVWFRYSKDSDYILKDFNLVIEAGQSVALVGESGAGKTTICNLINRYYELEKGEILIDGINIKDFKLSNLRSHIGLVSQDVFIFGGSLFDNIIYGDLTKNENDVINAIKGAQLDGLINNLSDGIDSFIGERGVKLSGGQKQRISLARVFLKNPSIMVLDEATSSLDNQTEREIQAVLEKLSVNRTNIIVAHRLTTIENADKIVVVSNNGIEEMGTHEELLKNKKKYYQLYNASLSIE